MHFTCEWPFKAGGLAAGSPNLAQEHGSLQLQCYIRRTRLPVKKIAPCVLHKGSCASSVRGTAPVHSQLSFSPDAATLSGKPFAVGKNIRS